MITKIHRLGEAFLILYNFIFFYRQLYIIFESSMRLKNKPIQVPFTCDQEIHLLIIKHRSITDIPTVKHLRRLIKEDAERNPQNYFKTEKVNGI